MRPFASVSLENTARSSLFSGILLRSSFKKNIRCFGLISFVVVFDHVYRKIMRASIGPDLIKSTIKYLRQCVCLVL